MGTTCTPNNPSHLFHLGTHSDLLPSCVPPHPFLPQGHGHRNATHQGDKRCSPDLVLSALLSDKHGATYAFSGKRCPPTPPSLPSIPPISFTCVSHLWHISSIFITVPHILSRRPPSLHAIMPLFTPHFDRCIWFNLSLIAEASSFTCLPPSTICWYIGTSWPHDSSYSLCSCMSRRVLWPSPP